MFEPGQKVVCIDDAFSASVLQYYTKLPVAGVTYTVRDIVPGAEIAGGETAAVYLVEIEGTINPHGIERGFHCRRFRELDELTDEHVNTNQRELVNV